MGESAQASLSLFERECAAAACRMIGSMARRNIKERLSRLPDQPLSTDEPARLATYEDGCDHAEHICAFDDADAELTEATAIKT